MEAETVMTKALKDAFKEAEKLPEREQDQLAAAIRAEIDPDEQSRNNVGGWLVRVIRPGHARKDFDYYATKDRAMAAAATIGLMLWEGQSRGTLMNVLRLADRNKPVVVYVQPKKGFVDVRTHGDLSALLGELDRRAARRLHADAVAEGLAQGLADQPALF
jgi:hypothetical protein